MNAVPNSRAHLIERAVQAMRGGDSIEGRAAQGVPAPPASPADAVAPLAPALQPVPAMAGAALAPAPSPAATTPPAPPAATPAPATDTVLRAAQAEIAARAAQAVPPPAPPGAEIPAIIDRAALARAGLVIAPIGTSRSRLSEEISIVQHNVLRTVKATRSADGRSGRLIMVTSARPGEGKTFISLNLAASLVVSGARPVVLVDADGKYLSVSRLMGASDAPGLRALANEPGRSPASLLIPTEVKRLSLLPYGPVLDDGPAIPPGQALTSALLRLTAALPDHLIVLDTPPCLSTSEPSVLAPVVGQVVMVVEAEKTQRAEVEAALDMVEACPTLQLVLNRATLTANDTFGAYGGYDEYSAPNRDQAKGSAGGKAA
jgi:receptor protein-tyrosine kinase